MGDSTKINGNFQLVISLIKLIIQGAIIVPVFPFLALAAIFILPFFFYFDWKVKSKKIDKANKLKSSNKLFSSDFEQEYKNLIKKSNVTHS